MRGKIQIRSGTTSLVKRDGWNSQLQCRPRRQVLIWTKTSFILTQWGRVQSFLSWIRNYIPVSNWLNSRFANICEHVEEARAAVESASSSLDPDGVSLLVHLHGFDKNCAAIGWTNILSVAVSLSYRRQKKFSTYLTPASLSIRIPSTASMKRKEELTVQKIAENCIHWTGYPSRFFSNCYVTDDSWRSSYVYFKKKNF